MVAIASDYPKKKTTQKKISWETFSEKVFN